jgi:type IX secretion system PorP/SprF family membrane protein
MKKLLYILTLIFLGQAAFSQQLPLYSQYMYNKFLINPALAGSDGYTSLNLTAREQWIGYSGSPRTYSLSFQTRFLKKNAQVKKSLFNRTVFRPKSDGKVGFGGYVFSDKNAAVQKSGFQTSYSYHFWLADYTQLSLGMALTGYFLKINVNEQSFEDPNEPLLNDYLRKGLFVPNVDCGVYLLNPKFDLGFSASQMFGTAARVGDYGYRNYKLYRHYYLFGSYNIMAGLKTEFEPSVLLMTSEMLKPQADVGVTYIYDNSFFAGLAYRTSGAVIANIRFRYIPSKVNKTTLFFGYAFDFTSNKIQNATYGTHEITVAVKFGDSLRKYRWLDRF